MNVAEWILVAILSITLFIFLVVGIILMIRLMGVADEAKRVAVKGQDIADNANDVVENMKGMTAIGSTMGMLVDKYVNPKVKEKMKETKKEEKK